MIILLLLMVLVLSLYLSGLNPTDWDSNGSDYDDEYPWKDDEEN